MAFKKKVAEAVAGEVNDIMEQQEESIQHHKSFAPDSDAAPQIKVLEGTTNHPLIQVGEYDLYKRSEALKLVTENGVFLAAIPTKFHKDPEILAAAVRSDQFSIEQVPMEMRNHPQVQQAYRSHRFVQQKEQHKLDAETAHILELLEQSRIAGIDTSDDVFGLEQEVKEDKDGLNFSEMLKSVAEESNDPKRTI